MADISPITIARFWSKVFIPQSSKACWEWQGSTNPDGYGNFRIPQLGRKTFGTHRVSYMLYNGHFPPEGLLVRHKCDNPRCVNPLHLESGTVGDNMRDAFERGQKVPRDQRGELNSMSRLTESDILVIKSRIAGGENNTVIARDYGVSHSMISCIRRGKSWAHVEAA